LAESANSDLNNSQVITKNQDIGGLDATVTVDHRVLTESGRDKIAEDIMKSDMLLEAVELAITTEKVGITDLNSEIGKQNDTYEAIKSEIANNPVLASQLQNPNLSAEEKQQVLNQLTHTVMTELGYVTEGYDNQITADENSIRQGFYSEETGDAYINDEHIDSTGELVETAGHEMAHAMDSQDGSSQEYSQEDRETYAHSIGEGLANYTDQALDISGYDDGMASSNNHVGNDSQAIVDNNTEYAGLDKSKGDSYLTPVQQVAYDQALVGCGGNSQCEYKVARAYETLDDVQEVERRVAQAQQIGQNIVDAGAAVLDAVISPIDTASKMIDGISNITPSSIAEGLNAVADEQHQQHIDRAEAFVEGDSEKLGQAEGNIASENLAGLTVPGGVGVAGKVLGQVDSGDSANAELIEEVSEAPKLIEAGLPPGDPSFIGPNLNIGKINLESSNSLSNESIGVKTGHDGARTEEEGGTGQALTGHGTYWNGLEGFEEEGSMLVPEGTAVTLPRQGVKLPDIAGKLMEQGNWEDLGRLINVDEDIAGPVTGMVSHLPGAPIPKYTLTPPDQKINLMENSISVDTPTNIEKIVEPDQGCVVWAACTNDYFEN